MGTSTAGRKVEGQGAQLRKRTAWKTLNILNYFLYVSKSQQKEFKSFLFRYSVSVVNMKPYKLSLCLYIVCKAFYDIVADMMIMTMLMMMMMIIIYVK